MSIRNISESFRHHIKIISKPNNLREIDQKPVPGLFLVPFSSQPIGNSKKTLKKSLRSQTISKSYPKAYLNHNPISKSKQNHIEIIRPNFKKILGLQTLENQKYLFCMFLAFVSHVFVICLFLHVFVISVLRCHFFVIWFCILLSFWFGKCKGNA